MGDDFKAFKLLVVEDNPGDFMLVEDMLEEQFIDPIIIQTTTFKKTREILLSNEEEFHCILLDLTLPDSSGQELIAQMLPLASQCPIIILTGYTDAKFSMKALSAGIADYLIKDELNDSLLHKSIIYAIKRRDASEKLLKSEARLVTAQSVAKIGSWETDLNTLEVIWSQETHTIFETSSAEFNATHASFLSFVHPDDKELVDEAFLKSFTSEKTNTVEHRIISSSGEVKYIEEIWQIQKDKNGNPIKAIGTCQDISEKVDTQKQLIKSERENRALIENITDGILKINERAQIVFQSQSVERISGFKQEEVDGKTFFELIHPEDRQKCQDFFQEVLEVSEAPKQCQYRLLHKNGHYFWIEGTIVNLLKDENVQALVVNYRDISERIEANNKIEETLLHLEKRVEERTSELSITNHALKNEVAERSLISNKLIEKNKSITDSINYAKRIQLGMLPSQSLFDEIFERSFLLTKPCHIVSGDFFWCHQTRTKKIIAVADCTGHGVPGALMSIIGNNLLNQIVIDQHIENPAEILELLDQMLAKALSGDNQDVKDGMDIALCVIDTYFKEVYFGGAYRPLFVSDENGQVNELKGNSFPIGGGMEDRSKQFDTKRLPIIPGQRIYLTSDGYYDQFGGPFEKKFMKKRFRKTLTELQSSPIEEQKVRLEQILTEWTGTNEQVDDVMVVGIEL